MFGMEKLGCGADRDGDYTGDMLSNLAFKTGLVVSHRRQAHWHGALHGMPGDLPGTVGALLVPL
jgi:hypothetical protein